MPEPKQGEGKDDFVDRCIPVVLEDGTAEHPTEAFAICNSMWEAAQEEKAMTEKDVKAVTKKEKDGEHPVTHYLVAENRHKPTTWRLRVRDVDGEPDHRLMGAAWAALTVGYRGNRYEGPQADEAMNKLRGLYEKEGMDTPGEKFVIDVDGEVKVGRVLSARNQTAIVGALTQLMTVLEGAGIDIPGFVRNEPEKEKDEEETKSDTGVEAESVEVIGEVETPAKDGADLAELKSLDLTRAIKLVDETPDFFVLGGYGHVWGNRKMRDLVGDYFTPDTDLMPDLVPTKLVFVDHALGKAPDGTKMNDPIGQAPEKMTRIDDIGKWVEAQISKRAKWVDAVMQLVERGVLAWSSGAVPHLVKRANDGWLERWPVAEYTGTVTPCEPRNTDISRLKAAYEAAGLKWLSSELETDDRGTESEGDLVAKLAVERELARLRLNIT
jgi:hypothetical protein